MLSNPSCIERHTIELFSPSEMHVHIKFAIFFQDLLDTLHVERSVPFQDLKGAAEIEERLLIVA